MKSNKVIKEDIIENKYRRKEKMSLISTYRFIRLKIEDVRITFGEKDYAKLILS